MLASIVRLEIPIWGRLMMGEDHPAETVWARGLGMDVVKVM
jgi:hypothetical protein